MEKESEKTLQKQHVLSHYDPAVLQVSKALSVAREKGAAKEVLDAIQEALDLVEAREDFTENYTTTPSPACENILKQTYATDWQALKDQGKTDWKLTPMMMTGPLEGQFLKSIVSMVKAKRILDIGMFTGYSALAMTEALPADGEMVTVDKEKYLETYTRALFDESPHSKKIKIHIGSATEYMKQEAKEGRKFDLIFLDADKSEYKDYMEVAFSGGLLSPGGTVLVDNAYRHGAGYMASAGDNPTKQLQTIVKSDASLHSVLVPMRDGVIMLRRKSEVEGSV